MKEFDKVDTGYIIESRNENTHYGRCVYALPENKGWYCYVQHECLIKSPNLGKMMMKDGARRNALKAIIVNYPNNINHKNVVDLPEIKHLEVLRWSKSRKSLICKAVFF